jgi:hypothetical protein
MASLAPRPAGFVLERRASLAWRLDLDRPPPRISAAKNDPCNQRVILLHQAGENIRASKISAIDGRDECQFLNLPDG